MNNDNIFGAKSCLCVSMWWSNTIADDISSLTLVKPSCNNYIYFLISDFLPISIPLLLIQPSSPERATGGCQPASQPACCHIFPTGRELIVPVRSLTTRKSETPSKKLRNQERRRRMSCFQADQLRASLSFFPSTSHKDLGLASGQQQQQHSCCFFTS